MIASQTTLIRTYGTDGEFGNDNGSKNGNKKLTKEKDKYYHMHILNNKEINMKRIIRKSQEISKKTKNKITHKKYQKNHNKKKAPT